MAKVAVRLAAVLAGVLSVLGAGAERLPENARPEHYALRLTPDLAKATFAGEERIDLVLAEPAKTVTVNALEIAFERVEAEAGGKKLPAKVTLDAEKETATFSFVEALPAGKVVLRIRYTGILNDKLRGFYLSKTKRRNYAVTQFESTDARRAFPSFDEPAKKATYDVTLVVAKGDTAISNTNIVADVPVGDGSRHAITFARTPKMSTYLLAFLVGDFECLKGESDGVPVRVCATPDQVQYGKFALEATEYALHYYDTYFGIKYPMPKLDMIALPDFEAGAMENFGAITYRETDLLLDDSHASVDARNQVAQVVTHEMAHQWFGDMVTMQWWDNVWLNEGFATWMEAKPVEAWKPEWKVTEEVTGGAQSTLNYDAGKFTRPIRAKAESREEIEEMFDSISYGKAGAVLDMVEHYLGEEVFRQGVHNYLAAHMYGNATAEDFWGAQTRTSGKPVDRIMESFVARPGVPILHIGPVVNGKVTVEQERFFLNEKNRSGAAQHWTVPVCFKTVGGAKCEVVTEAKQEIAVPQAPFVFANAGGAGYYRSQYGAAEYGELLAHVETDLTPEERLSLIGDQWALMRAGQGKVGAYLKLAQAVAGDASSSVLGMVSSQVGTVENRIAGTDTEREGMKAWVRQTFGSRYAALGKATAEESPEQKRVRAQLLRLAGEAGDEAALAEARAITAKWLVDPASVEPTVAGEAVNVAVHHGDAALYEKMLGISETAKDPQVRSEALYRLAWFHDLALVKRTLDYAVSGKVRNQDSAGMVAEELGDRDSRDLAWQYLHENWEKVVAQLTPESTSGLVGVTGQFCSAEKLTEVPEFFATHKVAATEATVKRAVSGIQDCLDLRAAQEGNLREWLAGR